MHIMVPDATCMQGKPTWRRPPPSALVNGDDGSDSTDDNFDEEGDDGSDSDASNDLDDESDDELEEEAELARLADADLELTPLGYHLARLPVDVTVGKVGVERHAYINEERYRISNA
jgi:hypothetical protein